MQRETQVRAESWSKRVFDGERFDAVRFTSCDLSRCRFRNCSFTASAFTACDLSRTLFDGCRFEEMSFMECDLGRSVWAFGNATELEWAESSLALAQITDCLLPGLAVRACDLNKARLENSMLEGARFEKTLGPGARFLGCNLLGAALEGCQFRKGIFGGGLFDLTRMADCDLRHAAFSEIRAAGVEWRHLLLEEATFHEVVLSGTVEADDVNPLAVGLVLFPDGHGISDPPPAR